MGERSPLRTGVHQVTAIGIYTPVAQVHRDVVAPETVVVRRRIFVQLGKAGRAGEIRQRAGGVGQGIESAGGEEDLAGRGETSGFTDLPSSGSRCDLYVIASVHVG